MSPSCQAESDSGVYALLIDGTTVLIRPARPEDEEAVRQMHVQMSPENIYLRFFSVSKLSSVREARRVTRPADADHCALLAWLGERLVGVASYEPAEQPGVAEIAFAVTDDMHGRGVATLLLDHLVSIARLRGVQAFTASTLASNAAMLRVFAAAGLAARRRLDEGVVETTFPLPVDEASLQLQIYLDSVAMRERQADIASLRHLLHASSVAVVGASRKPTGVGHAILRNILAAGFSGQVFAINPNATTVAGVPSVPSAARLPQPPDLVVIAVPAASVVAAAQDCGRAGARSLVVITAEIDADTGAELLATCRRFGMRLVGPNCFGIAVPGVGLNATFAGATPPPGTAGLIVQSGGIGIAVLEHLSRLGIGVSSFASVGDKYDVSSNDMLMWWEQDEITKLAVLYVESFGSPRRFAKTARRVGRQFPVLTVIGGRSAAGQRAAGSLTATATAATRTAVAGTPLITQEALFGQAGVIATTSLGDLVDAAAMLYSQPLPQGGRIGIVTNAGGAGVLAADACGDNDLKVAALSQPVMRRLRRLLPGGASVGGPVDATATVGQRAFKTCLEIVAQDEGVDAVMAITVRTALGDLGPALVSAQVSKPLVAVMLDQRESVTFLRTGDADRCVPAYLYPESAARALGHATRYGAWRAAAPGVIPEVTGVDAGRAREIVEGFLAGQRLGDWLAPEQAAELLRCYGIKVVAATEIAGSGDADYAVELLIAVTSEPVFGPLVVLGLGGELADVLDDQAARLTPLTDVDADAMIRGIKAAPLLLGQRGTPPVGLTAIADLLHRISRLADDVAEIAELTLNPVIARPDGAYPTSARIRLVPTEPQDPFLRRLR
jgi:acyl-CoA synthetase (NDP forming)/RimJ/RimL family protein N-acetyltransferase